MPLTVTDLINEANIAYGASNPLQDNLVLAYHTNPTTNHGDGLARFVAKEVAEVFDPQASDLDNVTAIRDALATAETRLADVRLRFDDLIGDLMEKP